MRYGVSIMKLLSGTRVTDKESEGRGLLKRGRLAPATMAGGALVQAIKIRLYIT